MSAIAIGHSSWGIGAPSGQNSLYEPHHSSPSSGRRPQNVGRGVVEERDPAVRVGRVDRDAERLDELAVARFGRGPSRAPEPLGDRAGDAGGGTLERDELRTIGHRVDFETRGWTAMTLRLRTGGSGQYPGERR